MSIYIWGRGDHGELGLGETRLRSEPTLLETTHSGDKLEWVQIQCGALHTVGLTKKGEVFSWGDNDDGQLGHGDTKDRSVPTKIAALDGLFITNISCGYNHTAALTDKGKILTWGDVKRQLTPKEVEALADEVIVGVACGDDHTCAVTSTGSIITWGWGIVIGNGSSVVLEPKLLEDLSSKGVISVSANDNHTACVTKTGEVFTWGRGKCGKLGHGDVSDQLTLDQETPKRVEALVGVKAKEVSCGLYHTAVCTEDGHVYTFGHGGYGQLGHGDKENMSSPALVQALVGKNITQVQCGYTHTMALTSSGYVLTWGSSDYGILGHGDIQPKCLSRPCLVEGLREHNVVQITSGRWHCAVLVDPTSPSIIRESQQASFNNKQHSDVVLMVENQPLYANVDVLTQKSDYFAAMFRSNMRESIERVVQVPDCSKASFLRVLEYLCLDGFTVSIDDVVELWGLADMYQIEGLKYCCMDALESGFTSTENVSEILEEVKELSCPCDELKRVCHENLDVQNLVLERENKL